MSDDPKPYAGSMEGIDFGLLNARNQLVSKVINPLLDMVLVEPVHHHQIGSETRYTVSIHIKVEPTDINGYEIQ